MPRARYPSDDRRLKIRPHVKVHLSWVNHPDDEKRAACADPEVRGIILGLWMVAVRAYAAETDQTVHLTSADIRWITGRERIGSALERLSQACRTMAYPIWCGCGTGTVPGRCGCRSASVTIPKLAKKQYFHSASGGVTPRSYAESEVDTDIESKRDPPGSPSPPPAVPRGTKKERKPPEPHRCRACGAVHPKGLHSMPDSLSDDEVASLLRWCSLPQQRFNEAQARHATQRVRGWQAANGKKKACWVATIRNAMTEGWALKGYVPPAGSPPSGAQQSSTFMETPREVAMKAAVLRLKARGDPPDAEPSGPLEGYSREQIEADVIAFMGPERARELDCEVP